MVNWTTIYLADDDADDQLLLTEAIKTVDPNIDIVETENGKELLAILQAETLPDKTGDDRKRYSACAETIWKNQC